MPDCAASDMFLPMHTLPDPRSMFERYEVLAREADAVFAHVKKEHSECLSCREGCSDCCHALFDLTLVEAAHLNAAFLRAFPAGAERSAILERAHAADRQTHAVKRRAFKASQAGENPDDILAEVARQRVRCPLLDDNDRCLLYEARPVTCRVYGVPTAIGGKGHVCGKSAFTAGKAYPTANMDAMHAKLVALSLEFAQHMKSGYSEIHTVLVPVSMALISEYNADYFGLGKNRSERNG